MDGISLWPFGVSCPGLSPSQPFVHLLPGRAGDAAKPWTQGKQCLATAKTSVCHQCFITPKHCMGPANREKINSIPAQTRILLTIWIEINAFLCLFEEVVHCPFCLWGCFYPNSVPPTRKCAVLQFVVWSCVNVHWQECSRSVELLPGVSWKNFLKENVKGQMNLGLKLWTSY